DFRRGLELQRSQDRVAAIELSALRDHELEPLVEAVGSLDLAGFEYVSVHAPSKLATLPEERVFELLRQLPAEWTLVVHPGLMRTEVLWGSLGPRLCIENMDNRKTFGRNVEEM